MYIELKEELIKEIERIKMEKLEKKGDLILAEDIEEIIEDLICEIHRLNEKVEDEIEQRENYWKPKTEYENLGKKEIFTRRE